MLRLLFFLVSFVLGEIGCHGVYHYQANRPCIPTNLPRCPDAKNNTDPKYIANNYVKQKCLVESLEDCDAFYHQLYTTGKMAILMKRKLKTSRIYKCSRERIEVCTVERFFDDNSDLIKESEPVMMTLQCSLCSKMAKKIPKNRKIIQVNCECPNYRPGP